MKFKISHLTLERLATESIFIKLLFLLVMASLIFLLFFIFSFRPLYHRLQAAAKTRAELQSHLQKKQLYLAGQQTLQQQIQQIHQQIQTLFPLFFHPWPVADYLQALVELSTLAGLRVHIIQPQTEVITSTYQVLPIVLSLQGNSQALTIFLTLLTKLPPTFTVDTLTIHPLPIKLHPDNLLSSHSASLLIDMTLKIYQQPAANSARILPHSLSSHAFKQAASIAAKTLKRELFLPTAADIQQLLAKRVSLDNSLANTPIEDLLYVGTLEKHAQLFGLIATPDQKIYLVQLGDTLGQEQGKIVQLSSEALLIHLPAARQVSDGAASLKVLALTTRQKMENTP